MTLNSPHSRLNPKSTARASLNARRRTTEWEQLDTDPQVDVLVVGGGVTGAGVALDAASRGFSVVLAERHDLAHGTSRWSSKLVHGGLRYLASGQVGVAYESATERKVLMHSTAPHLVRAMPQLAPVFHSTKAGSYAFFRTGIALGDLLRVAARTPAGELPRARWIPTAEAVRLAPGLRRRDLRGALLSWDGQLTDDARLVVAIARTAAGHGARVLTRCEAVDLHGDGALLRDTTTGDTMRIRARAVINATGVWAAENAPGISLRPSRGSHLVLPGHLFGGLRAGMTIPIPGERNRFVIALPQDDGRVYVGLTDEPADGQIPDVPVPTESERAFLLDTVSRVLDRPVGPDDILGAYAGLRPLLDSVPQESTKDSPNSDSPDGSGRTADLSRRHAVITGPDDLITVVGGKLTTYRRMAQDAVDTAIRVTNRDGSGLPARPCRTRRIPLVGAAPRHHLDTLPAPRRLIDRYGTESSVVAAIGEPRPVAPNQSVTMAEFIFAVRHEGATTVDDLLDRRTRIGLVPSDRADAEESAHLAFDQAIT